MPTTRPRFFVTESDQLTAALDRAHDMWPGLTRGQLLTRLALEGHRALTHQEQHDIERRRAAVARAGTLLSGAGAREELERLRDEDWPA